MMIIVITIIIIMPGLVALGAQPVQVEQLRPELEAPPFISISISISSCVCICSCISMLVC